MFFFGAFFKHRSEISKLEATNTKILQEGRNIEKKSEPQNLDILKSKDEEISKLKKQLKETDSKSEKIISDLQTRILKYESNEAILAKYPFDKSLGVRIDVDGNVLCPICVHENPAIEMIMRPEKYGWRCQKCNKYIRNDRPYPQSKNPPEGAY